MITEPIQLLKERLKEIKKVKDSAKKLSRDLSNVQAELTAGPRL